MPQLTLRLKRLGKKRVKNIPYGLPKLPGSLRELIEACVRAEVSRFNASRKDPLVFRFLTPRDIGEGATAGKVAFGDILNGKEIAEDTAVATALQGWADGLFSVFHGETELRELDAELKLTEGDNVTFIRLTFLTGTFW